MKKFLIFGVVGCLAVAFGLVWYFHVPRERTDPALMKALATPIVPDAPALPPPRIPPKGYKEFRNEFYRFQLFYPEDAVVGIIKEKQSAATITFESATSSFQIFIVPYGDEQISEARFRMDVPSGVIKQKTDVLIDSTPAVMFFGKDAALGETREVWFIARGFLYEVTTAKAQDAQLSEMMHTWQIL